MQKILLVYDGSVNEQNLILNLKNLYQWQNEELILIAITPDVEIVPGIVEMRYIDKTNTTQSEVDIHANLIAGIDKLRKMGFNVNGKIISGNISTQIARYASEYDIDLIVIFHKHEKNRFRRWLNGSVAKSLINMSTCNVLVVPCFISPNLKQTA